MASASSQQSKVVEKHTELEHTPSNLYQQAISRDSFHNWLWGLPGVCSGGVLQFSWKQKMEIFIKYVGLCGPCLNTVNSGNREG